MLSVLHTVLSYMIYSTVQVGLGMELFNEITHTHPFNGPLSRTTWVSRYQKGKTNLKQETVSGSGISWAICKSAPRSKLMKENNNNIP